MKKEERKRKINWQHTKFRAIAALLGLLLYILIPAFIAALGYAIVRLTSMVWNGGVF